MNLPPPPEPPPASYDDQEFLEWAKNYYDWVLLLYEFLKFPTFHLLKVIPRSSAPTETVGGTIYYDSDDDRLKCHNGTDWQDTY